MAVELNVIRIKDLFGDQQIEIVMHPEIPTVLTGPNGSGKSTILRLVHAVSHMDMGKILGFDFKSINLSFSNGESFWIIKDDSSKVAQLSWRQYDEKIKYHQEMNALPEEVSSLLMDSNYNIEATLESLLESSAEGARPYAEYRRIRQMITGLDAGDIAPKAPEWADSFRKFFQVEFISDKRLQESLSPDENTATFAGSAGKKGHPTAIAGVADRIGELLTRTQASYGRGTERTDQRLPYDVVNAMRKAADYSFEDVVQLATKVKEKNAQLRNVGLLDVRLQHNDDFVANRSDEPAVLQAVATILQSNLDRLRPLEKTEIKLTIFKGFLDRRLRGKKINLGGRRGMVFETHSGNIIRAEQLSSGEQHLVILAYDLVFGRSMNSLVIVDEPEISLHINWQDTLLEDFMELGRGRSLQFLLATHAPSLIAQNPECEVTIGDNSWQA